MDEEETQGETLNKQIIGTYDGDVGYLGITANPLELPETEIDRLRLWVNLYDGQLTGYIRLMVINEWGRNEILWGPLTELVERRPDGIMFETAKVKFTRSMRIYAIELVTNSGKLVGRQLLTLEVPGWESALGFRYDLNFRGPMIDPPVQFGPPPKKKPVAVEPLESRVYDFDE